MTDAPAERRRPTGAGLLRNTAYAAAPQVSQVLIALLLSPYIVHKVGLAGFGFWSIILAVLSFAQVADGGIPTLASRYIAAAHAVGDVARMRSVMALTVLTLAALGTAVTLIACVIAAVVPSSAMGSLPGWREAVIMGSLAFGFTSFGRGLSSVAHGFQIWSTETYVVPASQLVGAVVTVLTLELGLGLPGLGYAAVATAATMIVGYAWTAHRLIGLRLHGARPSRELWNEFREQGIHLQVVALVTATNSQADRLFLLAFAPLSFIGAYALGSRMAIALRSFPAAAFGPLITHVSAIYGVDGLAGARDAYRRALDVVASYGVAGLLALYGAMYAGILAWLGASYKISAAAATLIGIGYALNIITGPGTGTAVACGKAEFDRDYNLIGLALNLVLTPILGIAVGPWGVVIATTLGISLSSGWLLLRVDRWLELSWIDVLRTSTHAVRNLALGVVIGGASVAAAALSSPQPRLVNLAIASGAAVLAGLCFGLPPLLQRRALRQVASPGQA